MNYEIKKKASKPKFKPPVKKVSATNDIIRNAAPQTEPQTSGTLNIGLENIELQNNYFIEHTTQLRNDLNITVPYKRRSEKSLGGLIFGSLNVLNDDIQMSQEINQTIDYSENIQSLNRNVSQNSISSIVNYYNLDRNSFVKDSNEMDFCNLFQTNNEGNENLIASLEYGDIGFNVKYADYNAVDVYDENILNEANETLKNILNLYPQENEFIINMRLQQ